VFPPSHFACRTARSLHRGFASWKLLIFSLLMVCFAPVYAQDAPPGTIGRIEGKDISVEGAAAAGAGNANNAPNIYVSNGSVITVHSGMARMVLVAGGEIEICGPAKFTLLQSGGAITVALNFGRVHVILPLTTALRIFTPTIVATPLEIRETRRDVTLGLELDDSLCVVAASGALRLEQQFTGEILDVPQLGEFFLATGRLSPVAGTPGSCRCEELQARSVPAPVIPDVLITAKPEPVSSPGAASAVQRDSTSTPAAEQAPEPLVTLGVLAGANDAHPVAPQQNHESPDAPAILVPEYKIVMPPLTFSSNSPEPPPDPTPDLIMLVRVARAEPQWKFTGHVEAPQLEQVAQRNPATAEAQPATLNRIEKKKGGFWAKLKRAFVGG
jgi:hypothetical protein